MVMLDGTVDGGGDGFDDGFDVNEVDHSDNGWDPYDTDPFDRHDDFPQQEYFEDDAANFEGDQLSLDDEHGLEYGDE